MDAISANNAQMKRWGKKNDRCGIGKREKDRLGYRRNGTRIKMRETEREREGKRERERNE